MPAWASHNPRPQTRAGVKTELAEAPAMKIAAANCLAAVRQRSAHPGPKVRAEKPTIKILLSHVEEHASKKTKTFLFSPSFLNCCARKYWVKAGTKLYEILFTANYDKSLLMVPGFYP